MVQYQQVRTQLSIKYLSVCFLLCMADWQRPPAVILWFCVHSDAIQSWGLHYTGPNLSTETKHELQNSPLSTDLIYCSSEPNTSLPIWTRSGPMSNTPTMRAMKALMVLKLRRPILQEPSTSRTISAWAVVLHITSEQAEDSGVREEINSIPVIAAV